MATRERGPDRARDDEAAIVDRLLRKLGASGPPSAAGVSPHAAFRPPALDSGPASRAHARILDAGPRDDAPGRAGVWARVVLGVVVAAALTQWPHARVCGTGLTIYLLAVATVFVTGLWGASGTWRLRLGAAHALAVGTLLAALALAAAEILPRAGYISTPATWRCTPAAGPASPAGPAGSGPAARVLRLGRAPQGSGTAWSFTSDARENTPLPRSVPLSQ